jgi:alpha-L-fucosidase
MKINRRNAVELLTASAALIPRGAAAQGAPLPIAAGPYRPSAESFRQYSVPDWFRDAKFGIWAHWGPQCVPAMGDWYAHRLYEEGSKDYKAHLEEYGHPSKFGYKDLVKLWTADRLDPTYLLGLYKNAGAKYFTSMGVHHDNFDLWNSRYQPRWNAVATGPKKDIVGLFQKAAQHHDLKFGVSDHLWFSYKFLAISKAWDKEGPMKGVPYDGVDPQYEDLYHDPGAAKLAFERPVVSEAGISEAWKQKYFLRIKDLLTQYQPDLWYTDGPLSFEKVGLSLLAHHYNMSAAKHGGKADVVYTGKNPPFAAGLDYTCDAGGCVLDLERGVAAGIMPDPWQTDTCIGNWYYDKSVTYKSPKIVIDMLVDIVSRNGNLMLNFPLTNSGELDTPAMKILSEITDWMGVNGEAIHGTRPWKTFGAGPSTQAAGGPMNERNRKPMTDADTRFTSKGNTVYAFVMGWPEKEALLPQLGVASPQTPGKIVNVELLGHRDRVPWTQEATGLRIQLPAQKPCDFAVAFRITRA